MSRSYKHTPIVRIENNRSDLKSSNRIFRRRVNLGDFDDFTHQKNLFRRGKNFWDAKSYCSEKAVKKEIDATFKTEKKFGTSKFYTTIYDITDGNFKNPRKEFILSDLFDGKTKEKWRVDELNNWRKSYLSK